MLPAAQALGFDRAWWNAYSLISLLFADLPGRCPGPHILSFARPKESMQRKRRSGQCFSPHRNSQQACASRAATNFSRRRRPAARTGLRALCRLAPALGFTLALLRDSALDIRYCLEFSQRDAFGRNVFFCPYRFSPSNNGYSLNILNSRIVSCRSFVLTNFFIAGSVSSPSPSRR